MPFDFKKFDAKCANMSIDELQREWQHYTRLISGSATSTAVSGAAIPFTLGVSAIGVGLAAPAIHNARKKREIIERHLQCLGTTHHTRKRDVLAPMAISGTVGLVTLEVASGAAGGITNAAIEHGITSIAANEIAVEATVHLAVGGVAMAGEEHHMKRTRLAEAHNALLRQQEEEKVAMAGKIAQPTIDVYDPSSFCDQSQTAIYQGHYGDVKYEYSPVPLSTPVSEPIPPPYSPPWPGQYQDPSSNHQTSGTPHHGDCKDNLFPLSPNYRLDATSNLSPPESAQTRPQAHPVQIPSSAIDIAPTNQGQYETQSLYSQQSVQHTPQLMYPSYPTSVIPNSAHDQYGRLDQVMSELSITAMPAHPPTQVASIISRASTPKPYAPTSLGYCPQPQQAPERSASYFSPPSPLSPASPLRYSQPASSTGLALPAAQHRLPFVPSRSPSLSSVSSCQPSSPGQRQLTSLDQYGCMTPISTPGSHDIQSQPQKFDVADLHQNQFPPLPQMPASVQLYMNGHPTPAQTPQHSLLTLPQDYTRSPPQKSSYFQSSYPQPFPQVPVQGNWHISLDSSNAYNQLHASRGYPTPTATPSYCPEQQRQSTCFPPSST